MTVATTYANDLHKTLKKLMELKSKRDKSSFTMYQLAKALDMSDSMLVKLMHADPQKRVVNPRIDTLAKIVDFFKKDGFKITIDDLLMGFKSKVIEVQEQDIEPFTVEKYIPVYSFSSKHKEKLGTINIKLKNHAKNIIALLADEDINSLFKKGSTFIIDTKTQPQNDNLVAVKIEDHPRILVRKLSISASKQTFLPLGNDIDAINVNTKHNYSILGVIIQINAKT